MASLFSKLESMADRFINTLDGQLGGPIMRTMTGDVFTEGLDVHVRGNDAPVQAAMPVTDDSSGDLIPGPPALRPAPRLLIPDAQRA